MDSKIKKIKSRGVLNAVNISKSYGLFEVLKNVNFSVHAGEKIGLVAPNGTGKSTLLKILCGIEAPSKGKVEKGNIRMAYFPQEFSTAEKMSGGEKSKLAFIKMMSTPADAFLLDEPTNNLDLSSLVMMENFVRKSNKAFLIISHDREFLDRVVSKIIEIDEFSHEIRTYGGKYSDFLKLREERIENEWSSYNDAMEKKEKIETASDKKMVMSKKIEQTIANKGKVKRKQKDMPDNTMLRARAGKTARQAKILLNRIERNKMDEIESPKSRLPLNLAFEMAERSGDKIFEIKQVVKNIGKEKIGPIDLSVHFGERILIVGANGVGKSTLVKMLLGQLVPDGGTIETGSRLQIGYLPQENEFDKNANVLGQFMASIKLLEEGMARRLLNRFNITAEDVNKKIGEISPGIKSRLVLAILMANKVNCLVLDEPSNHLDLEALEALERALAGFEGTLILISHDRYFINKVHITKNYLMVKNNGLKSISDYQSY